MKRTRAALAVLLALVAALASWVLLRHPEDPVTAPTTREASPAQAPLDGSAPLPMATATDAADAEEPDWNPPGKTCRFPVPRGSTFAELSDAFLAAAMIQGYEPGTRRFPVAEDAGARFTVRDCRGDVERYAAQGDLPDEDSSIEWRQGDPLTENQWDGGQFADLPWQAERPEGRVWIYRTGPVGRRLGVHAIVAIGLGYDYSCYGFEAIVRLDEGSLVTEAVTPSQECVHPQLVRLSGRTVLLDSTHSGTGENGIDVTSSWSVLAAERGSFRSLGDIRASRSWGNGATRAGGWFGSFSSEVVDPQAATLRIRETWTFENLSGEAPYAVGKVRHVTRTYALTDGGLVRSPTGNPTVTADVDAGEGPADQ